jgi:hypothetical protein
MGILDLGSNKDELAFKKETKFFTLNEKPQTVNVNNNNNNNNNSDVEGKRVELHTVIVERGVPWERALEIYKQQLKTPHCLIDLEESTFNMDAHLKDSKSGVGFYIANQVIQFCFIDYFLLIFKLN